MTIYYFSGTGNSLKAAKDIAEKCGGCTVSMRTPVSLESKEDAVGFVFPVYFGGLPSAVAEFIQQSQFDADYFFTVVTYGGTVANAPGQVASLLAQKGLQLDYGAGIRAFPNYIAMYSIPLNPNKTAANQDKKVALIAETVKNRTHNVIAPKPFKPFDCMNKDGEFLISDDCISCGQCVKLCPVNNIELVEGKPQFLHKCEQCMACIQWCPKQAINTVKTYGRKRYRNPGITVDDLVR